MAHWLLADMPMEAPFAAQDLMDRISWLGSHGQSICCSGSDGYQLGVAVWLIRYILIHNIAKPEYNGIKIQYNGISDVLAGVHESI